MNDDKWGLLVDRIQEQFGILEQGNDVVPDLPNATREYVVFKGPMGKMMLERISKPKVVGEKSFGGSKYGTGTGVEKIYSPDEVVKTMKVYRDDDGEWVEMDAGMFED